MYNKIVYKICIVLFLICSIQSFNYSQSINFDSLYALLDTSSNINRTIDLHIKIGVYKKFSDEKTAFYHIDRAIVLCDSTKNIEKKIDAQYYKSTIFGAFGKYVESAEYLVGAEAYLDKMKDQVSPEFFKEKKLWYAQSKSFAYIYANKINEAIAIRYQVLDLIPQVYTPGSYDYHLEMGLAYNGLGRIYIDREDSLAVTYLKESIKSFREISYHPSYIFADYLNLVQAHLNLNSEFDLINGYIDTALQVIGSQGSPIEYADVYRYKCILHSNYGFYSEGIKYCQLALDKWSNDVDTLTLSNLYHGLGNCYVNSGNAELAVVPLLKSLKFAAQIEGVDQITKVTCLLAEAMHKSGDYSNASKYSQECVGFLKQEVATISKKGFAEAEAKFQTSQKEAEIARQELLIANQNNARRLLIGGSVLGLGLLGALFFGFYQRTKRKRQQTELALSLEHKRAEDLEELSLVKTKLFNNVSHELRTPLTLVIAPLKEVARKVKNVHIKNEIELALKNSLKLLNLTNEILDLSKLDAGKLELVFTQVHLVEFLKRVYFSFSSLAESRQIQLNLLCQLSDHTVIKTDIGKIEKILNNLISNAIKFSAIGGSVNLAMDEEALDRNRLIFSISDEGSGIPPEEIKLIFNRYYQSSTSSQASGTGIGLSLVKELAELLKGSVTAQSTLGEGSVFKVNIPVEVSKKVLEEEFISLDKFVTKSFKPILINGQRPRILIVEDNLDMAKYLERLFQKNYNCHIAYNGKQALDMIKKSQFDLISSDIMMPEMDGFEFRALVSEDLHHKTTPFIMLTARALPEDKLKGLHLGIDDYITKPFSTEEIKARFHNLLKNRIERLQSLSEEEEDISVDKEFVIRAQQVVIDHIDEYKFTVNELATYLLYSRRQLNRILKRLTGLTPVEFILEIRLQKAYRLIQERKYNTINEVRYEIGIESISYFSTKFKERFGINPSEVVSL